MVLPDEAPPLIWVLVISCVGLWWLWPWLERSLTRSKPTPATVSGGGVLASDPSTQPTDVANASTQLQDASQQEEFVEEEDICLPPESEIDVAVVFRDCFAEATRFVTKALDVPPKGPAYTAATAALHRVAEIIDRMFKKWGLDDFARLSRVREGTDTFDCAFGQHHAGDAARGLLALAGFVRQEVENGTAVWTFQREDRPSILCCMTVRLCLQRLADLQRQRGTAVWTQTTNEAVLPKIDDTSPTESLVLYSNIHEALEQPKQSFRERNTEVALRLMLLESRRTVGFEQPLVLHEGLAVAARMLASEHRLRLREDYESNKICYREGAGRVRGPSCADVRGLVNKLPLPTGFDALALYHVTHELPHVFGMASSTGGNGTSMGGKGSGTDGDQAAEIIAKETVAHWQTWKPAEIAWGSATAYGVGVCCDYSINRGFVVLILAGFEGIPPREEFSAKRAREHRGLRHRRAEAPKVQVAPLANVQGIDAKVGVR